MLFGEVHPTTLQLNLTSGETMILSDAFIVQLSCAGLSDDDKANHEIRVSQQAGFRY